MHAGQRPPDCTVPSLIRMKILGLVEKEKEKMGDGVQGEPDLSGKIVQGDLDAEEWQALSPDLV